MYLINNKWFRILTVGIVSFTFVFCISKINLTKEVTKSASIETLINHLEERIPMLMKIYDIPGVNIALVKDGRTVIAEGYGYADVETKRKISHYLYKLYHDSRDAEKHKKNKCTGNM